MIRLKNDLISNKVASSSSSSSPASSYYHHHHHHHGNHPAQSTASRSSAAATAAASSVSASSRLSSSSSSPLSTNQLPFAAALRDQEHEQQPPILRWSNDAHSGGVGERLFAAHYSLNPTTTAGGSTNPDHPQRQHQHQHQHHHQQQLSSDYPYPASLSYKSTSYMDPSGRSVSAHHMHNNHNGSSSSSSSRGAYHYHHAVAAAAAGTPSVSDMVVPSLDYDASSVAESSVNTFKSGQGPTNRVLEEGHDGVLQVPGSASSPHNTTTTTTTHNAIIIYDCAFSFLGCRYYAPAPAAAAASPAATAAAEAEWKTHVLSHFHTHRPPRKVSCPLCDWGFEHASDGARAWDVRMNHVAAHHRAGQRLSLSSSSSSSPSSDAAACWVDSHLFRYLWQKRIITDAEYQDLSSGGALRGPRMATMGQQVEGRRGRREWAARRVAS